jgi:hypothetical protein
MYLFNLSIILKYDPYRLQIQWFWSFEGKDGHLDMLNGQCKAIRYNYEKKSAQNLEEDE